MPWVLFVALLQGMYYARKLYNIFAGLELEICFLQKKSNFLIFFWIVFLKCSKYFYLENVKKKITKKFTKLYFYLIHV